MMERKFIRSGIPGLDALFGECLLANSIITVSGPTGAGKSTFGAQFLYSGATESNEPGLYISIEESRKDFFFHTSGYKWDFLSLEKDRKFILLDYPIHEVDQIVTQSSAIQEIINTTGVRRVVIDSIMPIALYFREDEERRVGFLKFIENLRKWNVTVLIISEDLKMGHSGSRPTSEYGIESFTDGWVNLFYRYDDKKMERSRYIEVVKMKGVHHSSKAYPIHLDDNGFVVGDDQNGSGQPDGKPSKAKEVASVQRTPAKEEKPKMKTLTKFMLRPEEEPSEEKTTEKPAEKISDKPKSAKPAPAKMTPSLAAKLADAKSKLTKKK